MSSKSRMLKLVLFLLVCIVGGSAVYLVHCRKIQHEQDAQKRWEAEAFRHVRNRWPPPEAGDVVYDNHGGMFPGLRVVLHPSGNYSLYHYTDAVNQDKPPHTGAFQKVGAAYTLKTQSGDKVYMVTTNNGTELLLDEHDYARYKSTGELRNPMRKAP